jgi:hypothetical protein
MKVYNGEERQERRAKHYITPIIFMLLELVMGWLIISIVMVNFNINLWTFSGKLSFLIFSLYSLYKTGKIYKRQKNYKRRR